MSPPTELASASLENPHLPTPAHPGPLSAAVMQSGRVCRPMGLEQSLPKATDRFPHADFPVEEPIDRLADMWVPGILFVLPPCVVIGLITAFPKHTFGVLGTSMLGFWCFTSYTVRVPLLREKMGVSSIMAVHGHYFCYCLLYGIVIYGNDNDWIDYTAKSLCLLAVLPLAVLFLWSVDTRRWDREHPRNDAVLFLMFPVLPLVLQAMETRQSTFSNSCLDAYPCEKVEILEEV